MKKIPKGSPVTIQPGNEHKKTLIDWYFDESSDDVVYAIDPSTFSWAFRIRLENGLVFVVEQWWVDPVKLESR